VLSAAAQKAAKKARPWSLQNPTPETDWHDAAFTNSPQWIKNAVAKRGELLGGVTNALPVGKAHYAWPDSIDMGVFDKSTGRGQSTWRHEYGHALDRKLTNPNLNGPTPSVGTVPERSHNQDFIDAMQKDANAFLKNDTEGMHGADATKAKAARAKARRHGYDADNDFYNTSRKNRWLFERFKSSGIDFSDFARAMKSEANFATRLTGVDLQNRYRRIIVAIELKDGQKLMDAISGGIHTLESNDTFSKGIIGNLSDLIGSATKNKVAGFRSGFGHEDAYYAFESNQASECFANLFDLYGHNRPSVAKMVEKMAPNMAVLFKKVVKNVP